MENPPRILAIVPAYNEAPRIGEVIAEIRDGAPGVDILVIDDASTDRTAGEAEAAGSRVITLPTNLGIGGAVQTGFKYAVEYDYDIVVQVDGDGQHEPKLIAELIKPIIRGEADVVIGSRYVPGAEDSEYVTPFARKVGILLFSWLTTSIIGYRITDVTSGFRAVNRRIVNYYARFYAADFPDSEATIQIHHAGGKIKEIPIKMRQRKGGKSSTTPLKSLYYPFKSIIAILATLLREKPRVEE